MDPIKKQVDEFIELLVIETGVSRKFMESARPSIETAYTDVPKEQLDAILDTIIDLAYQQAASEASIRRANEGIKILRASQERISLDLHAMNEALKKSRDALAVSLVSLTFNKTNPSIDS